jgi:MFS family permease
MLDAFDVMLYALVLGPIRTEFGLDSATAGWLQSLTLVASAAGGFVFGLAADRWGRTRALIFSVLFYSIGTALCGFAATAFQLAVFRIVLGLGMGGEWASGAALVAESWSEQDRGKALGFMQSSWAIGYALAAIVNWLVQDVAGWGWRVVFLVGVAPALFTVWVRRHLQEPASWKQARTQSERVSLHYALAGPMRRITLALTLMNACTMFAWWGLNTWVPSFLRGPREQGGIGIGNAAMNGFIVAMQVGMWLGYVSFGYISDAIGRRRAYVGYLLIAAILVFAYSRCTVPMVLLVMGPFVAFFATGYFSGFGAVTAELYPTRIRATAQGLTYNIGRLASAAGPWVVGSLAETRSYSMALSLTAATFALAALFWFEIPETKGRYEASLSGKA